jgi:2-amino-4-hydroxy-6-hydroxymethyldihydropteridine diphosphokinase
MAERAAIALGSNLGAREALLARARQAIAVLPGTRLVAFSPVEETAPLGPVPQGPYLNQMVLVETELSPRALLEALLKVEREEGRMRGVRWGPRTLDCDIVLYGEDRVAEHGLVIPHPELPNRDFWLRGLAALGVAPPQIEMRARAG